jgi:D-alanine-D-alanine ligase
MDIKQKYGKVAVIMGGSSPEREISLLSGNAVLTSLLGSGVDAYAFDPSIRPLYELNQDGFDKAVLMLHGCPGEDGSIQGALEYLKIPYTGSGVRATAIAIDKQRTKLIWQSIGIPLAKSQVVTKKCFDSAKFQLQVNLPVVVKPTCAGSTIGLSKVYELAQIKDAIELAFTVDNEVLIEELITGDEYTIVLTENKIYPFVKIEALGANYDYQNKYFTDDTKYICPAALSTTLQTQVEEYAHLAYHALGCRGVARVDFMVDLDNKVHFLELNTLPGMTNHSLVPIAFLAAGYSFDQLCLTILDGACLGG